MKGIITIKTVNKIEELQLAFTEDNSQIQGEEDRIPN